MISLNDRKQTIQPDANLTDAAFLLTGARISEECCSHALLGSLAAQPHLPWGREVQQHIAHCVRCAPILGAFRALDTHRGMGPDLMIALAADHVDLLNDGACQLFGHVSLENGAVTWCAEDDWIRSPAGLRITLVIDVPADSFGITVADVPTTILAVSLDTPVGNKSFDALEDLESFILACALTEASNRGSAEDAAICMLEWISVGKFYLHLRIAPSENRVSKFDAILYEAKAIERDFDYELPSGLHSDTHVNVGALCRSERHITAVAIELNSIVADFQFDAILTNGWAMGTIARRLAWIRGGKRHSCPIDVIVREGYEQSFMSADIRKSSKILVLVDVNVTGGLVTRMCDSIRTAHARVVGVVALVHAVSAHSRRRDGLRALALIPMNIVDATAGQLSPWPGRKQLVFNPVSQCMTERAPQPRSPSEFLLTHPEALEFWSNVDRAGAYEHHRREGETHYIAFINTQLLLEHDDIGQSLVERLKDRITDDGEAPEVLLIANRQRARLLANMLARSISGFPNLSIVVARRPRRSLKRHMPLRPWEITAEDRSTLAHRKVLVLDTACAQGATVDRLIHIASRSNAKAIKAAVLISRLPEGCEEAFSARLNGQFHCLYRLPIRPVVIRGSDRSMCPICQRRAAIEQASKSSGVNELERWALQIRNRRHHTVPLCHSHAPERLQLPLFPTDIRFLENCRQSVASGVTLHALNAAMTNGMAALTLPELFDERIPSKNRTAMIENLPQGAVEWSGECLIHDLRRVLDRTSAPNVWRASAEALVKSGDDDWFQKCDELISKLQRGGKQTSMSFWNHFACTSYAAVNQNAALRPVLTEMLARLAPQGADPALKKGVKRILQTVSK